MKQLNVVLEGNKAKFRCGPNLQRRIKKFFRYRPPGYFFSFKYRNGWWDGWVNLMRWGAVPIGLFKEQKQELELGLKRVCKIRDARQPLRFNSSYPSSIQTSIRKAQRRAVDCMIQNGHGIVLSATGSGKTFIAAGYFSRLVGNGLFIVDELTLLKQTCRDLQDRMGTAVGVVGGGAFSPKRITVATIQTLQRKSKSPKLQKWLRSVDAVIIDEIHTMLNNRTFGVVQSIPARAVFGLTATLELNKAGVRMQAAALAGPKIFEYSLQKGQEEGVLSAGSVCKVRWVQKSGAGEYKEDYYKQIVCNKPRNDCVESIVREALKRDRKVIVLVESLDHLRILSKRLKDVPHAGLSGRFSKEVRFEAKEKMDSGELNLIISTRIFAKGIDIKSVDTSVDATGLRSANNAKQRLGRLARLFTGKTAFLHVDISDHCLVRSHFASSARSRIRALRSLGLKVREVIWNRENPNNSAYNVFKYS